MDSTETNTNDQLLGLSRRLGEAVELAGSRVVALDARPRVRTSGVVWRSGLVVSTDHTIKRDEEITVTFGDGRQATMSLVGRDPGTDLAVLRIEGQEAAADETSTQFADSAALKPGNLVLAVGRAHPAQGVSASLGIVSVVSDKWRTWRGAEIDRLIRPDVSIFVGFSGGALVDVEGRIIGINTTGLARGAGLTIPASTVERVVDQLLASGRVGRPYLGVGMHPVLLPERMKERIGLSQAAGLIMLSVEAEGPADKAGITIGDVLLALGDSSCTDTDDVQVVLGSQQVGAVIKAKFLRGGEIKEGDITLGERPVRKG
jgi:S1-C subfamily serine protease